MFIWYPFNPRCCAPIGMKLTDWVHVIHINEGSFSYVDIDKKSIQDFNVKTENKWSPFRELQ